MVKRFWGKKPIDKTPPAKKNEQEYGPGKGDIMMCPDCSSVYYYKSWHHNLQNYDNLDVSKDMHFKLCPADEMKKQGLFEGYVVVEGFPLHTKDEIVNQIENIGERAFNRDAMDRILELHSSNNRVEVKTSDNQLALSIARQVHKAHKNSELNISLSKEEDVARARVVWPKE